MRKVVIYRAADAFVYLPIYIAEHIKIFQTMDKALKVKFSTPGGQESNDLLAIQTMIKESRKSDRVPIALCDPLAIFSPGVCDPLQPEDLRLIGALITKSSFWCVNGTENELSASEINEHFKDFEKIISYNETLATGNFLGKRLKNDIGIPDIVPVNFGEEIERLLKERKEDTAVIAITADIVGLAKEAYTEGNIFINHRFSKNPDYSDFLTTGLITTAEICENEPDTLKKVVEAIQRAILALRSSEEVALSVCQEIAKDGKFYQKGQKKLKKKEVAWVIDQIRKEEFYPPNLAVSEAQWIKAAEARRGIESWKDDRVKEVEGMYQTVVEQKFLEEAAERIKNELDPPKSTLPSEPISGWKKIFAIIRGDAVPLPLRIVLITVLLASIFLSTDLANSRLPIPKLQISDRFFMPGIVLLCISTSICFQPKVREFLRNSIGRIILGIISLVFIGALFIVDIWLERKGKPGKWIWASAALLGPFWIRGIKQIIENLIGKKPTKGQ